MTTKSRSKKKKTSKGAAIATATATKAKATRSKSKASMRITSRIVDVRRHTKGYVAGGKNYTVSQMRKQTESGNVRGVQVVGRHIQAIPGSRRLTDLPMRIMKQGQWTR